MKVFCHKKGFSYTVSKVKTTVMVLVKVGLHVLPNVSRLLLRHIDIASYGAEPGVCT